VTNPYLPQLRKELADYHKTNELDAFGLYAYGMVLKAGASLETQQKQAIAVLLESLKLFPHNWSAWLDIASLCEDNVDLYYDFIQPEITNMPSLNTHYMYAFFTAHMMLETQNYQESVMILDKLHHNPHSDTVLFASPFLLSKIAVNYYQLRDFATAANYFGTLVQLDPHRLEHMDVYSNILYVAEDRPNLSKLAHWAMKLDKYRPETCCIVGNYYSLLGQRTKAVSYFQRALKLDSSYTSAWTLMGHEFVELKNTAAAMECYRRAVDVSPQDYRAWYGLGQTYELLNMHLYALFYYRKAATLRRYDARMWCAIGGCYQLLGRKEDAIRSYQRAVSNNDREGIATQKLAALYRNDGKMEEAAQCYMRHLQLRYQATVSREPDEEAATPPLNTLINSVALEEAVAEALLFLSNYYRDHGEYETAALCCSRLLEYPGPEKEEGKALLREIRSRRERSSAAAGGPESPRRLSIRGRHEESGRRGRDDSSMSMDFSP
jgi:anaphase-promoting complex subunit 8